MSGDGDILMALCWVICGVAFFALTIVYVAHGMGLI
jgi:hypothetical protein